MDYWRIFREYVFACSSKQKVNNVKQQQNAHDKIRIIRYRYDSHSHYEVQSITVILNI
jgi:hypothetical protein